MAARVIVQYGRSANACLPAAGWTRPGLIIDMRTERILKYIPRAKSTEITYLGDLIYCFGNCKNIVIISDHQSANK